MQHEISGNSFHGDWSVKLRGPDAGFILSDVQARKFAKAQCGVSTCSCTRRHGSGLRSDSAQVLELLYCDEKPPPAFTYQARAACREYTVGLRREPPVLLLPATKEAGA